MLASLWTNLTGCLSIFACRETHPINRPGTLLEGCGLEHDGCGLEHDGCGSGGCLGNVRSEVRKEESTAAGLCVALLLLGPSERHAFTPASHYEEIPRPFRFKKAREGAARCWERALCIIGATYERPRRFFLNNQTQALSLRALPAGMDSLNQAVKQIYIK
jgi:hypothetical protein